jgi:hypothetical protein
MTQTATISTSPDRQQWRSAQIAKAITGGLRPFGGRLPTGFAERQGLEHKCSPMSYAVNSLALEGWPEI